MKIKVDTTWYILGSQYNYLITVNVYLSSLLSLASTTFGDRSGITSLRVGQWTRCYLVPVCCYVWENQGRNQNLAIRTKQIHGTLAGGVSQTWWRITEGRIQKAVAWKGGRMEMDGRRESSKVRRHNEKISCSFSRVWALKIKNWIWSRFT